MSHNASLGNLVLAWVDRLATDATFESLVGTGDDGTVRFKRGWPEEVLQKPSSGEFPRVTWMRVSTPPRSRIPEHALIATDAWDIPAHGGDATRGLTKVDAIDDQMLALLYADENAVTWYDLVREIYVSSSCVDSSDPPSRFVRRRRLWQVAPA